MLIENIIKLESENSGVINLIRDRLFWRAWERSAFLFVHNFTEYQVFGQFIKKVGRNMAWLGFPKNVLPTLQKTAESKGWKFEVQSDDFIVISGMPELDGYETWREIAVSKKPAMVTVKQPNPKNRYLPAYKQSYDLSLHIHRVSVDVAKAFRYTLAERIKNLIIEIAESLYLLANGLEDEKIALENNLKQIYRLRFEIRLLKDLKQINIEQWGNINQQIEILFNLIRAEFHVSRNMKETLLQSSGSLAPNAIVAKAEKQMESKTENLWNLP